MHNKIYLGIRGVVRGRLCFWTAERHASGERRGDCCDCNEQNVVLQEGSLDSKEDSEGTPEEIVQKEATEHSLRQKLWTQERLGKILTAPASLTAKQTADVPGFQQGGSLGIQKNNGWKPGVFAQEEVPPHPSRKDPWTQERLGKIFIAPATASAKQTAEVPDFQQGGSLDSQGMFGGNPGGSAQDEVPQLPSLQKVWTQERLEEIFTAPSLGGKQTAQVPDFHQGSSFDSQKDREGTPRETPQEETQDYSCLQKSWTQEGLWRTSNSGADPEPKRTAVSTDSMQGSNFGSQEESEGLPGKSLRTYTPGSSMCKLPIADWPKKLITSSAGLEAKCTAEAAAAPSSHGGPHIMIQLLASLCKGLYRVPTSTDEYLEGRGWGVDSQ